MQCGICAAENLDEIEKTGQLVLDGAISWREAARRLEFSHHGSLKNHMEKHYSTGPTPQDALDAELTRQIQMAEAELLQQMDVAPTEVKPLYAVAIRNLRGLADTRPTQKELISALKAIHEITGMKMGQQMMVQFARAAFPGANPQPPVIDAVEVLELATGGSSE